MKARATISGVYLSQRRKAEEEFELVRPEHFNPAWMAVVKGVSVVDVATANIAEPQDDQDAAEPAKRRGRPPRSSIMRGE